MTDVTRWAEPLPAGHPETHRILDAIFAERIRQGQLFGPQQSLPDGTGLGGDFQAAVTAKLRTEEAKRDGLLTWRVLVNEEIAEARAERDPEKLRIELVQLAALLVAWIEDLDRRIK